MAAFLAVSIRLSIGLAIASSIETSLEVTLNTLSIPYLISEALSFSTLPAITKILQGEPTVYVANDQPSAIRFLYLIDELRKRGPINKGWKWWGGYLSAQNNVLLSSIQP